MRETYAPVLLQRKTKRLQKETGNMNLRSKLDNGLTPKDHWKLNLIRPMKMLFLSPIVLPLTVYMGFAYGILYELFTTYTYVYQGQYNFTAGQVGLTYIPSGIGMFAGLAYMGRFSDAHIRNVKASGKTVRPEDRIPVWLILPGLLAFPAGILIYGWTTEFKIHWIVPMVGSCIMGFGTISIFVSFSARLSST
jgi:MFS family permease